MIGAKEKPHVPVLILVLIVGPVRPLKVVLTSDWQGFSDDELMTRAAALVFYAALSVVTVLLSLVWLLSMLHAGGKA